LRSLFASIALGVLCFLLLVSAGTAARKRSQSPISVKAVSSAFSRVGLPLTLAGKVASNTDRFTSIGLYARKYGYTTSVFVYANPKAAETIFTVALNGWRRAGKAAGRLLNVIVVETPTSSAHRRLVEFPARVNRALALLRRTA
jgi:hypothetical protein